MSSCLILQDENNFYIGADTACSVNRNGKYYRYHDNAKKIFTCGNDIYFCAGNLTIVQNVVDWINDVFASCNQIDVIKLSCFLKDNYLYNNNIFDIEVVVCRKNKVFQISQYNDFDVVEYCARSGGINIICCGYKTKEMYELSELLLGKIPSVKAIYKSIFNAICDNKVGGNIILYHNTQYIMYDKLNDKNVEYIYDYSDLHLLLADAVVAGHVEGSKITGGTISIGPNGDESYNFSVDSKGNIVANGTIYATAGSIAGYNIGAGGTYGNALYKRTSETSSSSSPAYEVGMKATDGDTDLAFFVKKSTNSWKSSENTFYINNSGRLYCTDGQIGGWEVGSLGDYSNSLYSTYCARSTPSTYSPEYATFMRSTGDKNTIAIGVKKRTSSSTEWTDADTPFYVRKDGYVFMNNADVTGKITASSGEISGNLTLSGSLIHKSEDEKYQVTLRGVQSTVTNGVFYITDKSAGYSQYPFRVNGDGSFTATKATIKGNITATSGTIGGCKIEDGTLQIKNANITGTLSASKISGGTLNCNSITVSNLSASSINTGSLSGSYITQGTVYGNRLVGNTITTAYTSDGINASLGYANFSNDVFNDRDTAYWIDTTYLTAESVSSDVVMAKSQLTARNGEFYLGGQAMSKQSLSFTDANGNTITIRYVGY